MNRLHRDCIISKDSENFLVYSVKETEFHEVIATGQTHSVTDILYNWLIWRVLKLAFFSNKYFPCIYFGVWSSQNNAIFM